MIERTSGAEWRLRTLVTVMDASLMTFGQKPRGDGGNDQSDPTVRSSTGTAKWASDWGIPVTGTGPVAAVRSSLLIPPAVQPLRAIIDAGRPAQNASTAERGARATEYLATLRIRRGAGPGLSLTSIARPLCPPLCSGRMQSRPLAHQIITWYNPHSLAIAVRAAMREPAKEE